MTQQDQVLQFMRTNNPATYVQLKQAFDFPAQPIVSRLVKDGRMTKTFHPTDAGGRSRLYWLS